MTGTDSFCQEGWDWAEEEGREATPTAREAPCIRRAAGGTSHRRPSRRRGPGAEQPAANTARPVFSPSPAGSGGGRARWGEERAGGPRGTPGDTGGRGPRHRPGPGAQRMERWRSREQPAGIWEAGCRGGRGAHKLSPLQGGPRGAPCRTHTVHALPRRDAAATERATRRSRDAKQPGHLTPPTSIPKGRWGRSKKGAHQNAKRGLPGGVTRFSSSSYRLSVSPACSSGASATFSVGERVSSVYDSLSVTTRGTVHLKSTYLRWVFPFCLL